MRHVLSFSWRQIRDAHSVTAARDWWTSRRSSRGTICILAAICSLFCAVPAPAGATGKPTPGIKPDATRKELPKGPLQIIISIDQQKLHLYNDGTLVADTSIATGVADHPTPLGIFSIIQKSRDHHSNIYSNAPMPFMERITWSGVALHAGVLPGYPASHGCIRLPHEFAVRLYGMTRIGARVIVTRNDITPFEIDHPRLAELLKKPATPAAPADDAKEEREQASDAAGTAASADGAAALANAGDAKDRAPTSAVTARPATAGAAGAFALDTKVGSRLDYIAESGRPLELRPAFNMLAGVPPLRSQAIEPKIFQSESAKLGEPQILPVAFAQPVDLSAPAAGPALRPGPISLFVSRKEGKLFVRKGFEPVFDMPVMIEHPEAAIGTHVFTAGKSADGSMRWLAVSVPNERSVEPEPARTKARSYRDERPIVLSSEPLRTTAGQALDRITLPPEALERITPLVTTGASLVIADQGLGPETGKETDFIVLTR